MRTWLAPEEPSGDVELVRDRQGDLWQRCRSEGWDYVPEYQHAGMEQVGEAWGTILWHFGPLIEVEPPEYVPPPSRPPVGGSARLGWPDAAIARWSDA